MDDLWDPIPEYYLPPPRIPPPEVSPSNEPSGEVLRPRHPRLRRSFHF